MREQLYQVRVIEDGKTSKDVGPKVVKPVAERFCDEIKRQIKLGNERRWSDPIVYQVVM